MATAMAHFLASVLGFELRTHVASASKQESMPASRGAGRQASQARPCPSHDRVPSMDAPNTGCAGGMDALSRYRGLGMDALTSGYTGGMSSIVGASQTYIESGMLSWFLHGCLNQVRAAQLAWML